MRKSITLAIIISIFCVSKLSSQATYVLDDFENGQVNFTSQVNVNPADNMVQSVVDNPVIAGLNTSAKAWKWTRQDAATDQQWAGFWANLTTAIPAGYSRIEVKFLRTNATSQLRIKCAGSVTLEFNPVTPASKTNEWETMVFDLVANGIQNITQLSFFPDYYSPIDVNATCYIDDITVVYDPGVVPPVVPANIQSLFHDSGDANFYDQSWLNVTAPSTLIGAAGHTDKFPVMGAPILKAGSNSLQLKWNSATTGNWVALVASMGWQHFDLTSRTHLQFWVNSPVALTKTNLPKIYFESHTGSPNHTGSVALGNYVNDLVANTWTLIAVPLADIWAADPTFTAKNDVKGVFFTQNAVDNVEHTLYLDEFMFVDAMGNMANTYIDFGDPGTSNITALDNWNNIAVTSNQLLLNAEGVVGCNLQVGNGWYSGYNYNGTTAPTAPASNDFPASATKDNFYGDNSHTPCYITLSGLNPAKYYTFTVFGSRTPATDNRETKYTFTGLNSNNSSLNTSNNTSNVAIVSNVQPTSTGEIVLKTEKGSANNNASGYFYLGAIKITVSNGQTTDLNGQKITEYNVYYKNGTLCVNDNSKIVKIYNIAGKLIVNENMIAGKANIKLSNGIYIAKTDNGISKFLVLE